MKFGKMTVALAGVLALVTVVAMAQAPVSVTLTGTNGAAIQYSDAIPVSGILDKIEIVQTGTASTNLVTLATYSGTTAVETFVSLADNTAGADVVRLRVLPTANTGSALAAASTGGTNTSVAVTTALMVPYQAPWIGGNVKMAVTGSGTASTNVWTVTATIYAHKPMSW